MELSKEEVDNIYSLLEQIDCCSDALKDETIRDLTIDIRSIIDPIYCPTCGACGETGDGCHNRCESLSGYQLFVNLEQYLLEKEKQIFKSQINRPNVISKIIDELKDRLFITEEKGFYCDSYIKDFNTLQKENSEYFTNVKELIDLLEKVETSDSGKEFSPNSISTCRVLDGNRLCEIIFNLKRLIG